MPLKVAFLNRGRDAFPGGDCVALDATMDALRRRGHECVETGWDAQAIRDGNFDLCHIMHCNFSWSWGNYKAVRDAGKKYVLTPVYYPGPLLSGITPNQLSEILGNASRIVPFSQRESLEIDLSAKHQPIPNATDESFHHNSGDARFGVVAISARGDTDKGVSMVRRICERLGITLLVLSGLSRQQLAEELKYMKVFVNASGSERMSLTIGEALCAGCRVLATDQNWGNSWYEGLVTFDPNDETKLEFLLKWALTSAEWDYRPNWAARVLTWDWVAEKIEAVYREILG